MDYMILRRMDFRFEMIKPTLLLPDARSVGMRINQSAREHSIRQFFLFRILFGNLPLRSVPQEPWRQIAQSPLRLHPVSPPARNVHLSRLPLAGWARSDRILAVL